MRKFSAIIVILAAALALASCSDSRRAKRIVKEFAEAAAEGRASSVMDRLYPDGKYLLDSHNTFNAFDLSTLDDLKIESADMHRGSGYDYIWEVKSVSHGRPITWTIKQTRHHFEIISTNGLYDYDLNKLRERAGIKTELSPFSSDRHHAYQIRMIETALPVMQQFVDALEQADTMKLTTLYPATERCPQRFPMGTKLNLRTCRIQVNNGEYQEHQEHQYSYLSGDNDSPKASSEDDYVYFLDSITGIAVIPDKGVVAKSYRILSAEWEENAFHDLDSSAPAQEKGVPDLSYIVFLKTKAAKIKEERERQIREEKERLEEEAAKAREEKEREAEIARWKSQGAALLSHSLTGNNEGKGIKFTVANLSNKTINYVRLTIQGYNVVDDPADYPIRVSGIGPLKPDEAVSWSFDDLWTANPSIIHSYKIKSMTIEFAGGGSKTIRNPQILPSGFNDWH